MNMKHRLLPALAMMSAFAAANAAEPKLPADGWASWEVAAVADVPAWCCWDNAPGRATAAASCNLDGRSTNYGARNGETSNAVKIYARVAGGKVERLQAFAASCPVQANAPIQHLGAIASDDSARWLTHRVKQPIAEDALAALALHRGDVARDALAGFARRDADVEIRKWALFWLAQSGAGGAEQIITEALRKDGDDDVREQAVFALSQLPDERATAALIATAEDQSLAIAERKRAVFWLSQSEANSAQAYMEKVLVRNAAH